MPQRACSGATTSAVMRASSLPLGSEYIVYSATSPQASPSTSASSRCWRRSAITTAMRSAASAASQG